MILNAATRTRILLNMTLDIDPTGSTVELSIDNGTWVPADWQGSPIQSGTKWTQVARTTDYYAGPTAVANGATVLTAGRHPARTRVTKAGDVLVANTVEPIYVTST